MATVIETYEEAPYYELTELEISKGYISLLTQPGRNIQVREINVLQGLLSHSIKDIGDRVMKNGEIVEGLEISVNLAAVSPNPKTVSVSSGRVYIEGRIWDVVGVPNLSLGDYAINDIPETTVDVVLSTTVVTEADDPFLRSPASGFSNFAKPGADRKKVVAAIALNSASGVTIYRLIHGVPLKLPVATTPRVDDLERRTYDESGNYLLTGLNISFDGEDLVGFNAQPQVKPTTGTMTGTISTAGHPYGAGWTNHIVAASSVFFTPEDIGRRIVIAQPQANFGTYEIVDVVTGAEAEIDGQLTEDAVVAFVVKDPPSNLSFTLEPGKAYVRGAEVSKPVSTFFSVQKALTGRNRTNELHILTFRSPEVPFSVQPYKSLITSGFEGVTTHIFYGMGMAGLLPPLNHESGVGEETNGPTRGPSAAYPADPYVDDLAGLIPDGGTITGIVGIGSDSLNWEWHLDPEDPEYPGKFSGIGTQWTEWEGSTGGGWELVNGTAIRWHGTTTPTELPPLGSSYKIACVISKTLQLGKDFRVRSNASARLAQIPGSFTATPLPATNDALFFPQATFNLTSDNAFTVLIDGIQVSCDFAGNPDLIGPFLLPGTSPTPVLTAVPIGNLVNVLNKVGAAVGKPNIASVQFDAAMPDHGYIVLHSPIEGSSSSIVVPSSGGNSTMGFPDGAAAYGTATPVDVLSLGGYRLPNLIAGSGGDPVTTWGIHGVEIDYEVGLERKDLVVINRDGLVSILLGEPDFPGLTRVPGGTISTLTLGSITIPAQSASPSIVNYQLLRLTMPDLRAMRDQIANLQYDLAVLDLDRDAVEGSGLLPTELSGVFSDGFVGFSKSDLQFSEAGIHYSVAMDVKNREILLSHVELDNDLYDDGSGPGTGIDSAATTINTTKESLGFLPAGDPGEFNAIAQLQATEFITLNPLGSYSTQPKIRLNPKFDNYPDIVDTPTAELVTSGRNAPLIQDQPIRHSFVHSWVDPRVTREDEEAQAKDYGVRSGKNASASSRPATDRITVATSDLIVEEGKTLLRQRTITVTGEGFESGEDNLELFFDGKHLDLTPVDAQVPGLTGLGLVKAKTGGTFVATFTIPAGTYRRLIHTVTTRSREAPAPPTHPHSEAVTTYRTWFWRRNLPEDSAFTGGRAFLPRKPAIGPQGDMAPFAQTFSLEADALLTSLDLFFGSIPSAVNTPAVVVQIRNVTNGVPGNVTYAEEVLPQTSFSGGSSGTEVDGLLGAASKTVTFKDPVYVAAGQQYAIVILTSSSEYSLAVGRIGSPTLGGGKPVASQPLSVGRILTSANGVDWTAVEDTDLKFILRRALFATGGSYTLQFKTVTPGNSFTRFILAAEDSAMAGSKITWFYSVNAGATYYPVTPFQVTDVTPLQAATSIKIRAILISSLPTATPIVLLDTVSVITRGLQTFGDYISKLTSFQGDVYNEVRQSLKVSLGDSGQVIPFFGYRDSAGKTIWIRSIPDVDNPPINLGNGFLQLFYKTAPTVPGPDHTAPAQLVSPYIPLVTTPTLNTTGGGNNLLSFQVVYWDSGNPASTAPYSKTVTVAVTLPVGAAVPMEDTTTPANGVVGAINAAAATASAALAVDLSNIASLNASKQLVLTHPQSGGVMRNKITITVPNPPLGFVIAPTPDFDGGGTIRAVSINDGGGALVAGQYYHYIVVAVNAAGESQDTVEDVDTITVQIEPGDDAVEFEFDAGFLSADATAGVKIYRTPTNLGFGDLTSVGLPGQYLLNPWIQIGTFDLLTPVQDLGVDSAAERPPDTGAPALLADPTSFRARVRLASTVTGTIPGSTPRVRDFTNTFVRAV